jgi:threonyl-tRNA synthetase
VLLTSIINEASTNSPFTLPASAEKSFDQAVSVFEVAKSIGSGLAKATLAGKVNGELVDASFMIEVNSTLSILPYY